MTAYDFEHFLEQLVVREFHVMIVCRVPVTTWTRMHPNVRSFDCREAVDYPVIEVDEKVEKTLSGQTKGKNDK